VYIGMPRMYRERGNPEPSMVPPLIAFPIPESTCTFLSPILHGRHVGEYESRDEQSPRNL
jgi:hypothetical protein